MYVFQLFFWCSYYYIYYSIYHQEEINSRDIHTFHFILWDSIVTRGIQFMPKILLRD